MAGYSGTPLTKKLGIGEGTRFAVKSHPPGFTVTLGPLPPGAHWLSQMRPPLDVVVAFFTARTTLRRAWPTLTKAVAPNGTVWVAWPKRSSGVTTDITEDTLREVRRQPVRRQGGSSRNLTAAGWRSVMSTSSRLRRGSKRTWQPGHQ